MDWSIVLVLHPIPNTWVVAIGIILEEWFFPHYQTLFFLGEVIWNFLFFIALLYTYGQTLGVASLGNVYFVEVQGTTPITKHNINFNWDVNSTQMFQIYPMAKHKTKSARVWVLKKLNTFVCNQTFDHKVQNAGWPI